MKATSRSAQIALQRLGEPRRLVLVDALHPELEGGDRPGVERRREPLGKIAADVERRDQIELAGRPRVTP